MAKRYPKKGRSRFKRMGRRSRWRARRTKLKLRWDPKRDWPLATGSDLDELAATYGTRRAPGEPDQVFRERILEEVR